MNYNFFILIFCTFVVLGQATVCKGPNEVWSKCGNNGCQVKCSTQSPLTNCDNSCKSGCICKPGYYRNSKGKCVLPVNCDTCSVNQTFSECNNHGCQNTCDNPVLSTLCDPQPGCYPGCICKENYYRNSKRECVLISDCDSCGGNPDKVWNSCGNVCPITCYNLDGPRICPAICNINGDCVCRPGLVQGRFGDCIQPSACPKCTGPNEFLSCGSACDTECKTLGETCPIINIVCNEMCYCKDGFARNDKGVCIPIDKCPPKCGPNEVFACGSECDTQCKTLGQECPIKNKKCVEKCYCKKGFARDYKGACIPVDKCPPKCGLNEVFDCGSECDTECKTLGQDCPIKNIKCVEKCYCVDGYARNSKGVCIPIKQCPAKKCPVNQVYNHCPVLCPPEPTCLTYGKLIDYACVETRKCVPRCECKSGFIRREDNGECIRPSQCCKDPNAEMVQCPNPCPGGTCEQPEFSPCRIKCPDKGCQCKSGYVKDANGKCILLSQCPAPCSP